MNTERNLLFGVLAFQADLIDAQRFAEACSRWAAAKDRPMSDILVDNGWISFEDQAAVNHLLNARLRKYEDDAGQSLAASCGMEAWQILAALEDTDIQHSIDGLSTSTNPGEATKVLPPVDSHKRYIRSRLHAQGGLGQVWVAHDRDLDRDVALKEILPDRVGSSELATRFLDEARITGQLEHPGIVPVYELVSGEETAAASFYTMRFVRGRTLSEAIHRYHTPVADSSSQSPSQSPSDRVRLRDLLDAFVSICNAVAYAHSRGVVHRDLKGSNVVLGKFGEVIVLDWGLAKAFGSDEHASDAGRPIAPRRNATRDTLHGQVLGTPAYMSPEQAAGNLEQVGPRSDVYSLGVILYEILVGQPPFQGETTADMLRKVIEQLPQPPCERTRGCPRPLDAICRKALNKNPSDRYPTATALADDVRCWLADEPVSAYREPVVQRLARWSRRHRTLVATTAALLLTALVASTVGLVLVKGEQLKTETARRQAVVNRDLARGAVDRFLVQVSSNTLLNQPGLQSLRRELLTSAIEYYQQITNNAEGDQVSRIDLATAFGRQAQLAFELGNIEEAFALNERARSLLVAPQGQMITDGTQLTFLGATYHNQGKFHLAVGDLEQAGQCFEQARQMRTPLVEFNKENAELRRLLAADYTAVASTHYELGRLDDALSNYQQALQLIRSPGSEFYYEDAYKADQASILNSMAKVYRDQNRVELNRQCLQEALPIQEELLSKDEANMHVKNNLARNLYELASLQHLNNEAEPALENLRRAFELSRQLSEQNPLVVEYRVSLGTIATGLARIEQLMNRSLEARQTNSVGVAAWRYLCEAVPLSADYQIGLMRSQAIQASLLRDNLDFEEAAECLEEAERAIGPLVDAHPERPAYAVNYANLLLEYGLTHLHQAQWESACSRFTTALEALDRWRDASKENVSLESTRLKVLSGLAEATSRLCRHEEALKLLHECLQGDPPAVLTNMLPAIRLAEARAVVRKGDVQRGLKLAESLPAPTGPPGYFSHEMACLLALASENTDAGSEETRDLADRAVRLLVQAREAGLYNRLEFLHVLKINPDLNTLRERQDFRDLLQAVELPRE